MDKIRNDILGGWSLAVATVAIALVSLTTAWRFGGASVGSNGAATVALSICLTLGLVLSYLRPVQFRPGAKIYPGSVALYLMAALLPIPLAALIAGVGLAGGELLVRAQRGTYFSDIATQSGRWVGVMLAGAAVAHLPANGGFIWVLPLIGAAAVLWAGDVVTSPLVLSPVLAAAPASVMRMVAREGGPDEVGLYVVGLIGAIVGKEALWALGFMTVPILLAYLSFSAAARPRAQARSERAAKTSRPKASHGIGGVRA